MSTRSTATRLRRAATAALLALGLTTGLAAAAPTAGQRAYLVITAPGDTAAGRAAVTANGGAVVADHAAIGVVVAHSSTSDFAGRVRAATGVQQVGAARTSDVPTEATVPTAPAQTTPTEPETVRPDMRQIKADTAWNTTTGSPSVTVGVLDTGVDDQHYDLKTAFDTAKSASCAQGRLDRRAGAWRDIDGHGTHVAGTIAAARNGRGAIGVAPGARLASVRVAERPSGLIFPENAICGFVFAADQGFTITNSSYYIDPWAYTCPGDADQAAIAEGVRRAVAYAEAKGVLNVAAAGNEDTDLAAKTTDPDSPDDSTPATRQVTTACLTLPAELPGVVTVSSITASDTKAPSSNFGVDRITVAAPGVDVYSTLPGGAYGRMSGTSMASPHVAGVAALMASTHPGMSPADLRRTLARTADDLACDRDRRCSGTPARNGFFGEGRVNAAGAVARRN